MTFAPSGFFVLRTPLLAFDELLDWGGAARPEAGQSKPDPSNAAAVDDRARLRSALLAIFRRFEVAEALFVASPSLFDRTRSAENSDDERARKVERALIRYLARMTGRATPFGLFAGCGMGSLGVNTTLRLRPSTTNRRHTRLDMDYLCSLIEAVQREPAIQSELRFYPNSSVLDVVDRIHYAEWRSERAGRAYHLVVAEASEHLRKTLERAGPGATVKELSETLTAMDDEIDFEDAREYVRTLIESQLLVSQLEPNVSGPEPIHEILGALSAVAASADVRTVLCGTTEALSELDRGGVGARPEMYRAIATRLEATPTKADLSRLFQVDLYRPGDGLLLGENVVREVRRGVELLHRISHRGHDRLSTFREAFVTRYEEREIPLLEALDEEVGVGFAATNAPSADASPLLAGLDLPRAPVVERAPWGPRDAYLLSRVVNAIQRGDDEIRLDEVDEKHLAAVDPLPLPDAFAALARLAGTSSDAINRGEFRVYLESVSGPSGAVLLGRFCHGDAQLTERVREHLRAEEALRPEAVYAEIVHLPEGRMGNVLLRPLLREFEIPFLGRSGAPADRQIPMSDLLVSVRGQNVILRSRRLNREVLPRLTSAHNFDNRSLGVYRFLCSLQSQGTVPGLAWSWGALDASPFLPRVTHGRLVLSRARWLVRSDEYKALRFLVGEELFSAVRGWRAAWRWPRWIVLADSDNELVIDLENILYVETFVAAIAERDVAVIHELFPPPDELAVRGPEGRFTNEIVIPFVRTQPAVAVSTPTRREATAIRRSFAPGEEWLTVKLYAGPTGVDRLLRELVRPIVDHASATGSVDRWFFLRFGDPEWHLRLRLHGDPAALREQVLPEVQKRLSQAFDAGLTWRIQHDTYVREIERYGGDTGIELSEEVFHADSEAALAIVETLRGDAGLDARWRLALKGMDLLMRDLGLDLAGRRSAIGRVREALEREFHAGAGFRRQMGDKFRARRAAVRSLLEGTHGADDELAPGLDVLNRRGQALAPITRRLRHAAETQSLTVSLEELAGSYLHMHANRLLRSAHRAQELVLYSLLDRYYESVFARQSE